jgi:outer membrane protein assembly factor BamA
MIHHRFFCFRIIALVLFSAIALRSSGMPHAPSIYNSLPEYSSEDTLKNSGKDSSAFKGTLNNINDFMQKFMIYSPLPAITYASETSWLFGLTKMNAFRLGTNNQNDTTIQPSSITATAYYTLNKQYKAVVTSDLMFGQNKWECFTEILFMDFPNHYYGVGDYTILTDECLVETQNFSLIQSLNYNIKKSWYIGIKYSFNDYFKVDTVADGNPCGEDVSHLEENEGIQSGIGLRVSREARDNRYNAKRGSYIFFEYLNYGRWIGSEFSYHALTLDLRKYYTPVKWLTVAGQFYSETKFGDVPIQSLSLMGGDKRMRGIYTGRFRDKTMIEGQVELRFPVYWIIGATVFAGLGEVAPTFGDYTWGGIKVAYGAGLRINVHEATRTNVRFDVGFFDKKPLFFFMFLEAF